MREMKDSGIKWIGKIPSDWEVKLVGRTFKEAYCLNTDLSEENALQFKMGEIVSKKEGNSKYNPESLVGYNIVEPNTIMINGLNLSFDFISQRVAIVKKKGVITSTYLAIFPNKEVLSGYALFLLKSYDGCKALHAMGRGLRATLNFNIFKTEKIILPPLYEQRSIAEFLDKKCGEIDELVGIEEHIIAELQAYKQAIITEAVTKGIGASGDEQQGENINIKLSRLCTSIGGLWIGERKPLINVGVIRNANFTKDFKIDYSKIAYIDVEASSFRKRNLHKGDLIVEKSGGSDKSPVGRTIIYEGEDGIYSFSNFTMVLRIIDKKIATAKYLYYYLLVLYLRGYMNILQVNTTGLHNLITEKFLSTIVCLPPLPEQQAIAEYLDKRCEEIDSIIEVKRLKIAELKDYKKSVIYEYVTGKKEII